MIKAVILLLTFAVSPHFTISNTKERFPVYWNVPSQKCYDKGIKIPLEEYGIKFNEGQKFYGDQVIIFYEYKFGTFPYFNNSNTSEPIHGGLPQLCNMAKHLTAVRNDVITRIPRESFDGVAVIDFEEWRPLFHLNWGTKRIYQRESIRLVKEREPSLSDKAAKLLAQQEFNKAAKKVFVETIKLSMRLRPYAKWGFYGFPYCNYDAGREGETVCTNHFQQHNDELSFVTSAGNALFPSIYLGEQEPHLNFRYVQAILAESRRVAAFALNPLPIYPYSKFEYNPYDLHRTTDFYVKRDMCNTVKQAADAGASGLVLWSTSYKMNATRCHYIQNYVEKQLGPVVSLVRRRVNRCSNRRCEGRGRCVLESPVHKCQFQMKPSLYRCECDSQFTGPTCKRHAHFPWLYALDNDVTEDDEDIFE